MDNPDQVIETIADNEAIPEADVREVYEEKLEQAQEKFEGEQAQERALKMLWTSFKRRQQSSSVKVEGVFIGSGDRYDAVGYTRDQALESYQQNPQKAIKDGKVAVAVPPGEEENLLGGGVVKVGEKNGWAIITHSQNEQILQYEFAERDPDSGEVTGKDDANTTVENGWRLYPLDTRERFGDSRNDNYGMPANKHSWTRRALGLFRRDGEDSVRISNVTFRGKQSIQTPPLYEPVEFKARVNEDDDTGEFYVNSTNDTEITHSEKLSEQINKTPDQLIESHFEGTDYLHDLESLYEYMQAQDGRRTVIVRGEVVSLDLEPNSNDTFRMVLGDMDFAGGELVEREVTVWVPTWQEQYIDFAVDSRVYVVGRANLQDAYDPEKGERTSEEQEVSVNAQGLYADPAFKIPREDSVEDMSEDDVEFSDEGGEEAEPEFAADGDSW